jgi:putative thiamine transport system ATP-binding protein
MIASERLELAMNDGSLQLCGVRLQLGSRLLIAPLTVTIARGEVVTLMGESGAGKSSLLGYLCGTLAPVFSGSGQVMMDGTDLATLRPEDRRLGILFQDDLLFPHLSVAQNLAFALASHVRSRRERRERIDRALAEAGLTGFGDRDPATLSGGQRARVAVIRVLLSEPRALLLDEPFSKLDASTRQRFREFVFDHLRRWRLPTLMVTHDPDDVAAAAGRVIQLPAGIYDNGFV